MTSPFGATQGYAASQAQSARISAFLQKVYGWMSIGLAITAAVALFVASSPALVSAIHGSLLLQIGLIIATFGMVIYMSARVQQMSPTAAGATFTVYAALMGVLLSFVFLVYTQSSIASTFLTCSATFGGVALYGTITKRDLTGVGHFAVMGLIGVVIASIVGIFWQNSMFQFVLSVCGVVVFTALAAWDAQRLKQMALALPDGQTGSYAVVGALRLYLDFINLFLFLLDFLGRRR